MIIKSLISYVVSFMLLCLAIVVPHSEAAGLARLRVFGDPSMTIDQIQARLQTIQAEMATLNASAGERDLTEDELTNIEALGTEFETLRSQLEAKQRMTSIADFDLTAAIPRRTQIPAGDTDADGDQPAATRRPAISTDNLPAGQAGFRSLGEFAQAVAVACRGGVQIDPRLQAILNRDGDIPSNIRMAASDTALERIGEEGGFLIPPDFREGIVSYVTGEETLLARCDPIPVGGNQFVTTLDETTPWQTSGGIQAYWEGEGMQMTGSRPKFAPTTIRANKITALVIASDELLEDAVALGGYINRKAPEKIDFKISLAIFNGSGSGEPAGILTANSTISVAKESGQAADTVVYANINNMWSAMYAAMRRNAVWLINQDIEPQLEEMTADGASGGHPVYVPGSSFTGGAADVPLSRLKGRPVIPTEVCETLGDLGDIMLIDFRQYLAIIKAGGVKSDVSIHLYFDYGETAFRFVMRIGGQSWWPNKITKRAGGNLGPAVSLAERA